MPVCCSPKDLVKVKEDVVQLTDLLPQSLRYWGLSEVEFILKTMSNAKVHDELASGAENIRS